MAILLSLNLGTLDGSGWSTPRPGRLYPQDRPRTYYTGGWVGLRATLDRCGKCRPHRDSIPGTFQPVASRYTDYAIPANNVSKLTKCTKSSLSLEANITLASEEVTPTL
jgi:hypothetical protein